MNIIHVIALLGAQMARNEKKGLGAEPVKMSNAIRLALLAIMVITTVPAFAIVAVNIATKTGGVESVAAGVGSFVGLLLGGGLIIWGVTARSGKCIFCGSWRVKDVVVYSSGDTDYHDRCCKRCGMSQKATPL